MNLWEPHSKASACSANNEIWQGRPAVFIYDLLPLLALVRNSFLTITILLEFGTVLRDPTEPKGPEAGTFSAHNRLASFFLYLGLFYLIHEYSSALTFTWSLKFKGKKMILQTRVYFCLFYCVLSLNHHLFDNLASEYKKSWKYQELRGWLNSIEL